MIWSCTFTQLLCGPISSKVVCHWISYSRWDFTLCLWFSLQLDQKFRYWLALAIIRIVRSRHVSGCVVLWYLQWCPPCDNEQAYGNVIWRKLHIQCPLQPRIFSCLVFSDETRPLHQPKRANRHEYMTIWRLLSNCSTISFFSRCNDQEIYGRCYIKRVASLMTSTTEDWFLMGVDLCTNRNGPIGAKLWQSEYVCPSAVHYPPFPDATTNKCTAGTASGKMPAQWPRKPRIAFYFMFSDGDWPLHRLKWTSRREVMEIWRCVSNCSIFPPSRWSTLTLSFVRLILACRCLLISAFSGLG